MKLSEVVNRINGNVDRFTTELQYYIGGEHFESNELEIKKRGLLKENLGVLGFKFHFAFQERDVIFMARNPHLRKAGMVKFAGLCSDASYILRSKDERILTQEFLAVQLQSDHFWDYCESHKVGSVNFANNWSSIANYEFNLPSIENQNEIASKVWAAYEVKQSYLNMIDATNQMVKAKFMEMFGGGKYPTKPISELFILQMGKTPERKNPNNFAKDGYTWLSIADMNDYQIYIESSKECLTELGVESCGIKIVPANTLIMSFKLTVGRVAITKKDLYTNEAIMAFLPKNNEYLLKFQYYLFKNTNWLIDAKQAVKGNTLNKESISRIELPLIPKKNQQSFVAVAEQAESTIATLNQSIVAIDKVIRNLINENL